jgi:hypothetical protein
MRLVKMERNLNLYEIRLYIQGLIYHETGKYYRMADGICFDDIEQALRKLSNE